MIMMLYLCKLMCVASGSIPGIRQHDHDDVTQSDLVSGCKVSDVTPPDAFPRVAFFYTNSRLCSLIIPLVLKLETWNLVKIPIMVFSQGQSTHYMYRTKDYIKFLCFPARCQYRLRRNIKGYLGDIDPLYHPSLINQWQAFKNCISRRSTLIVKW